MVKRILIGVATIIGIITIVSFLGRNDVELEATTRPIMGVVSQLSLKNIGSKPIVITDIMINDRQDCSRQRAYDNEREVFAIYNNDEIHKLWLHNVRVPADMTNPTKKKDINGLNAISLDIGDSYSVVSPCTSIVRASVDTDQGLATYSFSGN